MVKLAPANHSWAIKELVGLPLEIAQYVHVLLIEQRSRIDVLHRCHITHTCLLLRMLRGALSLGNLCSTDSPGHGFSLCEYSSCVMVVSRVHFCIFGLLLLKQYCCSFLLQAITELTSCISLLGFFLGRAGKLWISFKLNYTILF